MELFMNDFYLATIVAVLVTISIASHLFVVGTRGFATQGLLAALRSQGVGIADRAKRAFDSWVAAMLARRERQAVMSALNRCSDRELKDIGLYRGDIAHGIRLPEGQCGVSRSAAKLHSAGKRPR
jgi:uncharacterized protein YjiS (DUF1127 family)